MEYKKWSFKLFIYVIILTCVIVYMVINTASFNHVPLLPFASYLVTILAILGTIFGVISFQKKEATDYKKMIGLFGNMAILLSNYIILFFES